MEQSARKSCFILYKLTVNSFKVNKVRLDRFWANAEIYYITIKHGVRHHAIKPIYHAPEVKVIL